MKKVKDYIFGLFGGMSHDIGIDLGTANTLVHVKDHGIVIDEPSVVALNTKTGRVVAVGAEAKHMLGRNPHHIEVIRPLVEGVISDFEITEEMLRYLITKAQSLTHQNTLFRPRVVVGVPSGITSVERRAVIDAARSAGAKEVYIVEEPMAAAIGVGMPVHEPVGSMVVDIGGGTTDMAIISLGGVVQAKSLKIAGDHFSQNIKEYIRDHYQLLIGDKTTEEVKVNLSILEGKEDDKIMHIRGRDAASGLPREIAITSNDVAEAIHHGVMILIDGAKEVLELAPPEIVADVMRRGMMLVGGGANIVNLDKIMGDHLKIPVHVAEDPLSAVVRGAAIMLEDIDAYKPVLMQDEYETL